MSKLDEDMEEKYSRRKNSNSQIPQVGRYLMWLRKSRAVLSFKYYKLWGENYQVRRDRLAKVDCADSWFYSKRFGV